MMTALAIVVSYALGSVPTGFWLGLWFRGIDIREHGSRNIGATNTLRVLGKGLGAAALLGDMAKGWVSVELVARLSAWEYAPIVCGLAAICGHTFSLFLRFRGGKGVATSAGVFLGLATIPTAVAIGVFAVVVAATRMVSAGSILASVTLAGLMFVVEIDPVIRWIGFAVAALVVVRHRENIQRILKGTENRF